MLLLLLLLQWLLCTLIICLIANVAYEVTVTIVGTTDGLSLITNVVDENVVTIVRTSSGLRSSGNIMFRFGSRVRLSCPFFRGAVAMPRATTFLTVYRSRVLIDGRVIGRVVCRVVC